VQPQREVQAVEPESTAGIGSWGGRGSGGGGASRGSGASRGGSRGGQLTAGWTCKLGEVSARAVPVSYECDQLVARHQHALQLVAWHAQAVSCAGNHSVLDIVACRHVSSHQQPCTSRTCWQPLCTMPADYAGLAKALLNRECQSKCCSKAPVPAKCKLCKQVWHCAPCVCRRRAEPKALQVHASSMWQFIGQ
jgi:hypothetical protein